MSGGDSGGRRGALEVPGYFEKLGGKRPAKREGNVSKK